MKYWRGYLTAAIIGFFTWALTAYAKTHTKLIDMVYPYLTRMIQGFLAPWSGGVDILLWQLVLMLFLVGVLVTVVLGIVFKWNPIQHIGWILAVVSLGAFLHTGIYGLNGYAGPMADDIRLNVTKYNLSELEAATAYYRDRANALATQIPRDSANNPKYSSFEVLASQAGDGFRTLTYERGMSIFAGDTTPVKKLGWADYYSSVGITGKTVPLTGESAVNPQIPVVSIPFTMNHEMAHRMCIVQEQDANFAAFLACDANESIEFQYSGYFMAFRYCYNSLVSISPEAAARVLAEVDPLLLQDIRNCDKFFQEKQDDKATKVADKVNDTYIKASGNERGIESYSDVVQLLVCWHIQEVVLPQQEQEEEIEFDPYEVTKDGVKKGEVTNG